MQEREKMNADENQIVVYQPNETVRLDVRLENETVWLTQAQLCALFGVVKSNVSYHLKNIFGTNELDYGATVQKFEQFDLRENCAVAREAMFSGLVLERLLQSRYWSRAGRGPNKMRKFILAKSVRVSPVISFLLRVDKFPQRAKEAK